MKRLVTTELCKSMVALLPKKNPQTPFERFMASPIYEKLLYTIINDFHDWLFVIKVHRYPRYDYEILRYCT